MGKKSREKRARREVERWEPFVPSPIGSMPSPEVMASQLGIPLEVVKQYYETDVLNAKIFVNNLYTVFVKAAETLPEAGWPETVWLSIKRNDREPIHDWRHFQRIKNELVGPECEGIELFPAESRLVDTANQYHLWVFRNPDSRFPLGFSGRMVMDHDPDKEKATNTKQRKL